MVQGVPQQNWVYQSLAGHVVWSSWCISLPLMAKVASNHKWFIFLAFFGKSVTIVEAIKVERMTASGKIWGVSLIA
jgi:hypothetical protein